jgi:hypothetical protein
MKIELIAQMARNKPTKLAKTGPSEESIIEVTQVLDDLKKDDVTARIKLCPRCKSPNLRFRETWYDIGGAMGLTPPKYRCLQCGYLGHVIIEATNEDLDERILELIHIDAGGPPKLLNEINQKVPKKKSP